MEEGQDCPHDDCDGTLTEKSRSSRAVAYLRFDCSEKPRQHRFEKDVS